MHKLRRYFPPHGHQYELLDTSAALLWITTFGYLVFPVPPTLKTAIGAPLVALSETNLGLLLGAACVFGCVAAYVPRWTATGYAAVRIAALFMALNFAASIVRLGLDWAGVLRLDSAVDTVAAARAAFIYVMVYGWAFRRLKRDNREA